MKQLETSVRVNPYSAIGPGARRNIIESTKLYYMIARVGWSAEVLFLALNCTNVQAGVHQIQICGKSCSVLIEKSTRSIFGGV